MPTHTYAIACGDVMPGCAARLEAESEDDLMRQVVEHARVEHELTDVPPDVEREIRSAIVRR